MPETQGIRSWATPVIVFLLLALALFINLDGTPPPWWDEGWTLLVAKTWVEQGMYARLLNGQLASSGLSASPPTTALVAFAFRTLGIGLAQARFAIALVTWLSFAVLYLLIRRLYDERMALATILVGCLMSIIPEANPITMGRQVLAEPLMLLLLVAGALLLYMALERSFWFILPAIACWGVANMVKAQVLPFWAISLAIPLGAATLKRQWHTAAACGVGLVGGYLAYRVFLDWLNALLSTQAIPAEPMTNLIEAVAFVPVWANRLLALAQLLTFELPLVLALVYGGWVVLRTWNQSYGDENSKSVQLSLYSFAGSWLMWYLLSANAILLRYLYPPVFIGSIFIAALLRDLTDGFDLKGTIRCAGNSLRHLRLSARGARALGTILLTSAALTFTLKMLGTYYWTDTNTDAQRVAEWIDLRAPPGALVESFESELFFFLRRPYHYPPDQMQVQLARRMFDRSIPVRYDSLAANPDFLVVGRFSSFWPVYDGVLGTGAFRLVETIGEYKLYERVR